MVGERNLGLVAREASHQAHWSKSGKDSSKDELQHRMEALRESISHTVDEDKGHGGESVRVC
jgi:hypothetical protein